SLDSQGDQLGPCPAFDHNADGKVTIDEVIRAVEHALSGCPSAAPTATPAATDTASVTVTSTETPTPTPTATTAAPEPTATVDEASTDPERVEARLRETLEALAALGNKRAGTEADAQAGDYVAGRFRAAGLSDVHFEEFSFPHYDLHATRIEVTSGEQSRSMTGAAFAYPGTGRAEGEAVFAGTGRPQEYAGIDATGKVVLVRRVVDY